MEVPRHWRLQKQRYGLVGIEFGCGHKVFPPREICPICSNKNEGVPVEIPLDEAEVFFIAQVALAEGV